MGFRFPLQKTPTRLWQKKILEEVGCGTPWEQAFKTHLEVDHLAMAEP